MPRYHYVGPPALRDRPGPVIAAPLDPDEAAKPCAERNVVRDDDFTCALCDGPVPHHWNFA